MTDLIIKKALKIMEASFREASDQFSSSEKAKDYVRLQLGNEKDEVFSIMLLDNQNRLIEFIKLFRGTINQSNIYLRPIARLILEKNAAKIILAHNHPSGEIRPSQADIDVTKKLIELCDLLECKYLDHIITSAKNTMSFTEEKII